MQINPILIKDMKTRARIVKIPIFVMVYNAVLAFIAIVMLFSSADTFGTSGRPDYRVMNEVFAGMGIVQCALILLVTLIVAAGSFSNEREKGTLDILLMTPVRTWELVNGKMFAAVLTGFLFTFSSLPILALGTIYGGTDVMDIIYLQCILLIMSLSAASIGLLCSSVSNKTSVSVAFSLVVEAGLLVGPFIFLDFLSTFFYNSYQFGTVMGPFSSISVVLLSFNPVMFMVRFYDRIMGTNSMMDRFNYYYGIGENMSAYKVVNEYFPEFSIMMQLILCVVLLFVTMKLMKKRRNVS